MALALVQQIQIGLNQEALTEWIEYREFKKKPLSPMALSKSEKFLLKYDETQQQYIVDQAIMNDWQGLHHVDPPKQQTTRQRALVDDLNDTSWATA